MRTALIACLSFLALTGCSRTNLAQIIKAAAADEASVCFTNTITTPWGADIFQYGRTNKPGTGSVSCNTQNGFSAKSDGAQVGVPITVVPQISVGTPTSK